MHRQFIKCQEAGADLFAWIPEQVRNAVRCEHACLVLAASPKSHKKQGRKGGLIGGFVVLSYSYITPQKQGNA